MHRYTFILHTLHKVALPHYMLYTILHSLTTNCIHYYSLYCTHIYTPILDSLHVVTLLQYPLYRQINFPYSTLCMQNLSTTKHLKCYTPKLYNVHIMTLSTVRNILLTLLAIGCMAYSFMLL